MKLYYSPGACSLAPHSVLEELGVPFELVKVNLHDGDQRKPEYLKINPKAKVPALGLSDGQVLTENPAILSYLADTHPQAGLLAPVGELARARAQEWLAWCASTVHTSFGMIFGAARLVEEPVGQEIFKKQAMANTQKQLDAFDRGLDGKAYVMGERFTIADAYTLVFYNWSTRLGLRAGKAHRAQAARLSERPAIARALATEGITLQL
jgi:glutathione S-transferase